MENSSFSYHSFRITLEKTIKFVEGELCKILSPFCKKEKVFNQNNLDPNLSLKECLIEISGNPILNESFEKILQKNYNLANWHFWLDLTNLIDEEKGEDEMSRKLEEIVQKYLSKTSMDEVNKK